MREQTKRNRPVSLQTNGRNRAKTRNDYINIPWFGYVTKREMKLFGLFMAILSAGYALGTFGLYELFQMTGRL